MKSMMLTGIRKMEMRDVPDPVIVNTADVIIKMKVAGVCGSDIHYYVNGRIGSQVVSYPFTVGHEGAGEVMEVGPGVSKIKKGDRIAIEPAMPCLDCDQCFSGRPHTCRKLRFLGCPGQAEGCLSEYILMPESSCFTIPGSMSYDEATISEPLAIGLYSVRQAMPVKGSSLGVLGFGPIGMSVMLSANAKKAGKIYVTDRIPERANLAVQTGAVWSGNPDKEDIVKGIKKKEPLGLDAIFECCGKQEAMNQAVNLVKPGGKILIVGIPEFDNWTFCADELRRKEISLINIRRQNHALEETLDIISNLKVNVKPMVTHRFDFENTPQAFNLVSGYKDGVMKALIDFSL